MTIADSVICCTDHKEILCPADKKAIRMEDAGTKLNGKTPIDFKRLQNEPVKNLLLASINSKISNF